MKGRFSSTQRVSRIFEVGLFVVATALCSPALDAGNTCTAARWVGASSAQPLPSNVLQAGEDGGQPVYLCRAPYSAGMHPGKIVSGTCHITYGVKQVEVSDYQVLVDAVGSWKNATRGYDSALRAGWEHGHNLYLCRAQHEGALFPGKVVNGTCHINYGDGEISAKRFELFYPSAAGRISAGNEKSPSKSQKILGMMVPVGPQASVGGSKTTGSSSTTTQSSSRTTTMTATGTQTTYSSKSTTTGHSSSVYGGVSVGPSSMSSVVGALGGMKGHRGGWMYPDCSDDSASASPDKGTPQ